MLALGFATVVLLFLLGTPIWIALSSSAFILLLLHIGLDSPLIPITFFGSADSFTLMACPFFLLAGNVMAYGGCAPYIFNVMNSFVGRIRAGMPFATVLTAMVYAAITGSTAATLAGIAAICLPNMRKAGYSDRFSAGLMASSATLGQLIPPSLYMIVYGAITLQNVGDLFISGIIPGVICAGAIAMVAYFKSPKVMEHSEEYDPSIYSWSFRGRALWSGAPALIMPVIVLGGIYGGIVTPTEAGALSCVYGIVISVFVYREMKLPQLVRTVKEAAYSNSMVFMLVSSSMLFALPLTYLQIPQNLSRFVANSGLTGTPLILAVTAVYLVLGCFLDSLPILYLVLPIVLPSLQAAGVNLIHFNIITVLAMQVGQITPPFGLSLFISGKMMNIPTGQVIRESLPYLGAMVLVLLLIIFVPSLSTVFVS